MSTHPNLSPYKDHDVVSATVSIRRTGDGLSKAMNVDPVELPLGSKVHVVLECEVEKHRYEPLDKDHPSILQLVNMLVAGRATIVDGDIVAKYLDEQQKRIEQAEGVQRLPGMDDEDGDEPSPLGDAMDEAVGALEDAEADGESEEDGA
jgi:hypothetical protein